MGLVSLKCPNCGGQIDLDDKKEFGFCMHCGNKVMIQENIAQKVTIDSTGKISNWIVLGLNALKYGDYVNAEANARLILESDTESGIGWFVLGCSSIHTSANIKEGINYLTKSIGMLTIEEKKDNYHLFLREISLHWYASAPYLRLGIISTFDLFGNNEAFFNLLTKYVSTMGAESLSDVCYDGAHFLFEINMSELRKIQKGGRPPDVADVPGMSASTIARTEMSELRKISVIGMTGVYLMKLSLNHCNNCRQYLNRYSELLEEEKELYETVLKGRKRTDIVFNVSGNELQTVILLEEKLLKTYSMDSDFFKPLNEAFSSLKDDEVRVAEEYWKNNTEQRLLLNQKLNDSIKKYEEWKNKLIGGSSIWKEAIGLAKEFFTSLARPNR